MTTMQVKVLRRQMQAEGIDSFELGREDGAPLPAFSAGSHIDIHLPGNLIRQYSLCNDQGETHRYRIAVLRDPASRGGSVAMHEHIKEGDLVTISEPRNHFALEHAPHTLLLAGGIGITPLLCMAQRLGTSGGSFELHYCTRSPARTAFRDEVAAFGERAHLHYDDGDAAQKLDLPAVLAAQPAGARLYVCGPTGFIDFVVKTAKERGWPADRIHLEYFGAAPQDTTGDQAFEVRLASTGKAYTIPADKSVTEALHEQGVEILVSCEQGVCGTCITRVLEGECDHRDLYFTDEEKAANDQFTPCCSRAKSKVLVLDL
ncbi:PDR/VanB family oxidoreductase [Ramlibacter rhizophilus]|uniref:Oxidoreductase n=1 Tax=Ramlibacter rhizophilus TaxID=1781167 RepID=A0A4Z0BDJ9_9BURK|nr:PDR/VanB family oxidoreductase [Ramlibacter rhizophilus]TFY96397.1 oxidoreductase [Ramlibacter rhizophilus]